MHRFSAEVVAAQVEAILGAWGMPDGPIAATVASIVDTDLSGIDSHGVSMLMMYERLLHEGRLAVDAVPQLVLDTGAYTVVDARDGLGHPAAVMAMELAVERARVHGIAASSVRNSNHFGAVGYYVRLASTAGLIGLGTTSTRTPAIAPLGGSSPLLGTNPIAFSAPREHGEPLVVDMSTSVVAMNKVKAYALKGMDVPAGWLIDRAGRDVTDSARGFEMLGSRGATLTLLGGSSTVSGGHKGFGLSLIVQVLSAALTNASQPGTNPERDNLGHFFLAIDPELINPGGRTARNVEELLLALAADGPEVTIPGTPEARTRHERLAHGIPLPDALLDHLRAISERAGAAYLLHPPA